MGKKAPGKKHENKVYENYEAKNDQLSRKKKFCPKCGSGTMLAQHKDRVHCGKCAYTEFTRSGQNQAKQLDIKEENPKQMPAKA